MYSQRLQFSKDDKKSRNRKAVFLSISQWIVLHPLPPTFGDPSLVTASGLDLKLEKTP